MSPAVALGGPCCNQIIETKMLSRGLDLGGGRQTAESKGEAK